MMSYFLSARLQFLICSTFTLVVSYTRLGQVRKSELLRIIGLQLFTRQIPFLFPNIKSLNEINEIKCWS